MNKLYNRIVLIGNGFDLAAGLKTSYLDFMKTVVKNAVIETIKNGSFKSDLINIRLSIPLSRSTEYYIEEIQKRKTAQAVIDYISNISRIDYQNSFVQEIIKNHSDFRWVDIEQYYFERLKIHFHRYLNDNDKSTEINNIIALNECMEYLTQELNTYMKEIQNKNSLSYSNSPLSQVIDKCHSPLRAPIANLVPTHSRNNAPDNVIFLNFNYTNTVESLTNSSSAGPNNSHIHIHGSINDKENPIIFGYGNDTAEEYEKLEVSGENEFLKMVKSFQYPRTNNYHNLLNILSSKDFDVFIIGHSCGLSDKTLLKTIFEHQNCLCIQNFHYRGEREDFYKRIEISRHFSDKALMRERILPFDKLAKIPQSHN